MKISALNPTIKHIKKHQKCNDIRPIHFCGNEDIFIKNSTELQTGDKITGIGLIIDKPKIQNNHTGTAEDCLITYQNYNKNGCFRLIKNDKTKIKNISEFFKSNKEIFEIYQNNSFSFSDKLINQIEQISPKVANDIKDVFISEIVYTTLCKKQELQRAQELGYKKIDKNKDIICIQNFIVYHKEYNNASRYVSVPLLNFLSKKNDKNIIIKANAFGKESGSPVRLYLRYGFLPLKVSLEDIEKHKIETKKGLRLDPSYQVIMYLPENAILYESLRKIAPKYAIDTILPQWYIKTD